MKVLWMSLTPSLGAKFLNFNNAGAGWIEALESSISKNDSIELGVMFYTRNAKTIKTFTENKTTYFALPEHSSKWQYIYKKLLFSDQNTTDIRKIRVLINQFAPDIIHIFGTEKGFGLINETVDDIPIIFHLQGIINPYLYKWYRFGFSKLNVLLSTSFFNLLTMRGLFYHYYYFKNNAKRELKILKRAKYICGRTDWDRRVSLVLASGSKYFHCEEILREVFYKYKWKDQKCDGKFLLITTCQNNIYKGLETILDTASLFKESVELDFEWNIAGIKKDDEIVKIVERSCKKKFSNFNINLLGFISAEELAHRLSISDLYIHPSHIENSPNSVCEAMLVGIPIIATYAGGTSTILENGMEGILIQDGDPYSLAGTILELKNNFNLCIELSSNAKQKAIRRHDPSQISRDVYQIYREVLKDYK